MRSGGGTESNNFWKYVYLVILILWFLFGLFVVNQYINFTSRGGQVKGGTLVEGVSNNISFLPYWSKNKEDYFYQSLLFSPCYNYSWKNGGFNKNLCVVDSKDNQIFDIKVNTGFFWSDGRIVSVDDIFFTYNNIVKNNAWDLPGLDVYNSLQVTQPNKEIVRIKFPNKSIDNKLFFSQFVLPKHILQKAGLDQYTKGFASNPIGSTCVKVKPQSRQGGSLVFDFGGCSSTFISYYQIKTFQGLSDLDSYLNTSDNNIISFYQEDKQYPNYRPIFVPTNVYSMIFFNTSSQLLSPSINRVLGGLVFNNFFDQNSEQYILKNPIIFDTFYSTGKDVKQILEGKNPSLKIDKHTMENSNVKLLSSDILFSGSNLRHVFYIETLDSKDVSIKTSSDSDKLVLTNKTTDSKVTLIGHKNFLLKTSSLKFKDGLNKLFLSFSFKGKEILVGNIDLYSLNTPNKNSTGSLVGGKQIKVLYFKNRVGEYIVNRIKEIFSSQDILPYFYFVRYEQSDEFEGKITSKDYDIVIRSLDLGQKKDLSTLLLTDSPNINPSLYKNTQLSSFINQYIQAGSYNSSVKSQIDGIYGSDMPFVVLGQVVYPFYLKSSLNFSSGGSDVVDFKTNLINNIKIVNRAEIKFDKVFSGENLKKFFLGN